MKKINKLFLTTLLIVLIASPGYSSDWSLECQTPANDREEVDLKLPLKQLWYQDYGFTMPLLMDGKLYLVGGAPHFKKWFKYVSGIELLELDKKTGVVIGRDHMADVDDGYTYCRAIGYDGKVYTATAHVKGRYDIDEKFYVNLYAYDLASKQLVWSHRVVVDIVKAEEIIRTSSAWLNAADGKVALAIMDVENNPKLLVFDANTGKLIWSTKEPPGYINNSLPAIADGKIFLFTNGGKDQRGTLTAFDLNNGNVLWQKEFIAERADYDGGYGQSRYDVWNMKDNTSLVFKADLLYLPLVKNSRYGALSILSSKDGSELCRYESIFKSFPSSTPIIDQAGDCFVDVFHKLIFRFDVTKQGVSWEISVPDAYQSLAIQTKDTIAYTTRPGGSNYLVFQSKTDGKEVARYPFNTRGSREQIAYIDEVIADNNFLLVHLEDGSYFGLEGSESKDGK